MSQITEPTPGQMLQRLLKFNESLMPLRLTVKTLIEEIERDKPSIPAIKKTAMYVKENLSKVNEFYEDH